MTVWGFLARRIAAKHATLVVREEGCLDDAGDEIAWFDWLRLECLEHHIRIQHDDHAAFFSVLAAAGLRSIAGTDPVVALDCRD